MWHLLLHLGHCSTSFSVHPWCFSLLPLLLTSAPLAILAHRFLRHMHQLSDYYRMSRDTGHPNIWPSPRSFLKSHIIFSTPILLLGLGLRDLENFQAASVMVRHVELSSNSNLWVTGCPLLAGSKPDLCKRGA